MNPGATSPLIGGECGGSDAYRGRLRRLELQRLADRLGLAITVAHLPPATSKWKRIERRMFGFIRLNWRGVALVSFETSVQRIGSTTTSKGLELRREIDKAEQLKGRKVTDAERDDVRIERDAFHGDGDDNTAPHAFPAGSVRGIACGAVGPHLIGAQDAGVSPGRGAPVARRARLTLPVRCCHSVRCPPHGHGGPRCCC